MRLNNRRKQDPRAAHFNKINSKLLKFRHRLKKKTLE